MADDPCVPPDGDGPGGQAPIDLYRRASDNQDPGPNASRFRFPAPHGEQAVVAYPGGEVLTIPRHVDTERVRVLMTASTFGSETFTSEGIAAEERAKSSFLVVVAASSPQGTVRAWVKGRDIYRVGALTAVEAVLCLEEGGRGKAGPLAPAQVLETEGLFAHLGESGLVGGITVGEDVGSIRLQDPA